MREKVMNTASAVLLLGCVDRPPDVDDAVAETSDDDHGQPDPGDQSNGDGDGDGDEPDDSSESPVEDLPDEDLPLSPDPRRLAVGSQHTCVLGFDGSVHCWGHSYHGELGLGHVESIGDDELPNAAGPVPLPGPAVDLAAGHRHTCALLESGEVICWGANHDGQLGRGDLAFIGNNEVPSLADAVDIGAEVVSIHAGANRSCAITSDRDLVCWGDNWRDAALGYAVSGDIGDDEPPSAVGTVDVGGSVLSVAMSAGNTCALLEGGDVRCWGIYGNELAADYGDGESIGDDEPPSAVPPIELAAPAIAIAAGWTHFCALLESGAVSCWGEMGEPLGYGSEDGVMYPALVDPVAIGAPAVAIGTGLDHSCAITDDGSAYCWGNDTGGQLGYPDAMGFVGEELRPIDVGPIDLPGPVLEIDGGSSHTCARIGTDVHCWGWAGTGQTGTGATEAIGDDEPPASAGPVQYLGGQGNGGVATSWHEFDGQVDARLQLGLEQFELPIGLEPGQIIRARGSWEDFCDGCGGSFAVRSEDDQTLIVAGLDNHDGLHPHPGLLAMFGMSAAEFTAPLQLSHGDPGLCGPLADEECPGEGQRLLLEASSPDDSPASLLDGTRGHAGGGYYVSVERLQQWDECYERNGRSLLILRQDCAPDCGPVMEVDACVAPSPGVEAGALYFPDGGAHEIGYDITCVILDQYQGFYWMHDLDCIWNT
ncbi:MAG TPA: hypothetical protein VK034_08165 [Enhygromyxa sp.]|nr:hypothetical protein [Enhygromyxa sp.]